VQVQAQAQAPAPPQAYIETFKTRVYPTSRQIANTFHPIAVHPTASEVG